MDPGIDLLADLNAEDDDGLGWSTLSDARDSGQVRPGAPLVAGNRHGRAIVRVVAVDDDGQVRFIILPGPAYVDLRMPRSVRRHRVWLPSHPVKIHSRRCRGQAEQKPSRQEPI